jgi:hypothetical protein
MTAAEAGINAGGCVEAPITPEQAIDRLAERLYWNMERLDPGIDSPEWAGLSDRQHRFYRLLVEDLSAFDGLVKIAQNN